MDVAVYGAGYVGLVTATCFAHLGHRVICADINKDTVNKLNQGIVHIYEPGLEKLIKECLADNSLKFTTDIPSAISHGEVQFIAVGTPPKEDGSADLTYVYNALNSISKFAKKDIVVAIKSTVPAGTCLEAKNLLATSCQKFNLTIVSCPEFLREGTAVQDFLQPDRIVVGTESQWAQKKMEQLFLPLVRATQAPLVFMKETSAELTKYTANAFLAMKVSFINEISRLSEAYDADIFDIKKGIAFDPRIGDIFLQPGCGYGGSCFPKDVQALQKIGQEKSLPMHLNTAVHKVNEEQKKVLFNKINAFYRGDLANITVAIWGLSFKPETDDIREASSVSLITDLLNSKAKIQAYDPKAMPNIDAHFKSNKNIELCPTKEQAIANANCLVIVTEWDEFKLADPFQLTTLKDKVIFDGRNALNTECINQTDLSYFGIGITQPKQTARELVSA